MVAIDVLELNVLQRIELLLKYKIVYYTIFFSLSLWVVCLL